MIIPFAEIIGYLKGIQEVGDKNKKTIERLVENWDKDRKDFREFEARLSHVEVELKSMAELVSKIPSQTRDRLAEAAEPIITGADNLTEAINNAETVPIDNKQRKSWWAFWKRGGESANRNI